MHEIEREDIMMQHFILDKVGVKQCNIIVFLETFLPSSLVSHGVPGEPWRQPVLCSDIVEFVHFNLLLAWSAWCSQTLGGQLLTSHHHCYPHRDTVITKLSEVTIVCEGLVTSDIVYCSTEVIKKVRMTHENWTNVVVCLLIIHLYMQGVMKPAKEIINLVSK